MHRANASRLLASIAIALFAIGCQTASTPEASGPIAARIGDDVITVAELDAFIKDDLFERETRGGNPSRTHDLRSQALEALVRERAVESAATSQGLTHDALLDAELAKTPPVSDAAVKAFYEENRAQLQGAPLEAVAPRITEHLEGQRRRDALEAIVSSVDVEIQIERPRVDVRAEGPSRGPDDAAVTIVEYSDFQCPYCKRATPVLDRLVAKYPEDLRIVYRHLPLDSIHPHARAAAEASACAGDEGLFWEYHDLLFANPRAMAPADLQRYAKEAGLDTEKFDACLSTRKHAPTIDADVKEASAVGISGTPAFVVNGIVLFGLQPEEALDAVIQEELARSGS